MHHVGFSVNEPCAIGVSLDYVSHVPHIYLCRSGGFLNLQVGVTGRCIASIELKSVLAVFKISLKGKQTDTCVKESSFLSLVLNIMLQKILLASAADLTIPATKGQKLHR